jgi:hypothetical protein
MTSPVPPTVASAAGETAEAQRRQSRSRLRTPQENGALLQIPLVSQLVVAAQKNAAALATGGRDAEWARLWPSLEERKDVRTEVLAVAEAWTQRLLHAALGPVDPRSHCGGWAGIRTVDGLWFVTGHQPALFHPGVWIKNFAASRLARAQCGAVGLNLIVDNDLAPSPAVAVPEGSTSEPRWGSVPYDAPQITGPWEETQVANRLVFSSFGDRLGTAVSQWGWSPLVRELWPRVLRAESELGNPGWAFAAARTATEWDWGFGNLEIPLSAVCQLRGFQRFTIRLLNQLPRFHTIYNKTLADYRQLYKLRSQTHPVPDLRREHDWLEAPFWIWRNRERQRRRLLIRLQAGEIELADGREVLGTFPPGEEGLTAGIHVLQSLASRGIKLRTRALTTTLFSRLYFADLFIHGIGGAKYDEITDQIVEQFCGGAPPVYATLSATLRLPLPAFDETVEDLRRQKQSLRAAEQHPQDFLDNPAEAETRLLVEELDRLIQVQHAWRRGEANSQELASQASTRYRQLQQLRQRLLASTRQARERISARLKLVEQHLAANLVLRNREFAFCLFPTDLLRSFAEDACRAIG